MQCLTLHRIMWTPVVILEQGGESRGSRGVGDPVLPEEGGIEGTHVLLLASLGVVQVGEDQAVEVVLQQQQPQGQSSVVCQHTIMQMCNCSVLVS